MGLQKELLQVLEQLTENDIRTLKSFLTEMFAIYPTDGCDIGTDSSSSVTSVVRYNGVRYVSVKSTKAKHLKNWLLDEGFYIERRFTPNGTFLGYKVYLSEEYAC